MKTALILFIDIHGSIHLLGFLKAYKIPEFTTIIRPISKPHELFWLLTFILFVISKKGTL